MPPVGADVSHLMGGPAPRGPARPEDFTDKPAESSWLDSAKNFVTGFAHSVDPRPALKLLYDVAQASPMGGNDSSALMGDLKGLGQSQIEQFKKGKAAYDAGRISEAVGHTIAGALPLVGPAAAEAGERIGSGDVAGGLGAAAGLVAPMAIPRKVGVTPLARNATPQAAEAVAFGRKAGIPIDAATATGSPIVAVVQKRVSDTMGGAGVAEDFKAAQAKGLATVGEQLAAKAHGQPMTAESAGQAARDAVHGKVRQFAGEADTAYDTLRTIEADPKHARDIEVTPTPGSPAAAEGKRIRPPGRFAQRGASDAELWNGVLGDARNAGFTGDATKLKAAFQERLSAAKEYLTDRLDGSPDSVEPVDLLRDIRRYGGLKPSLVEGSTRGSFSGLDWNQRGGAGIFRADGHGLDGILERLHQDPKWQAALPDTEALVSQLELIGRNPRKAVPMSAVDVETALPALGVDLGSQWWKGTAADNIERMALPVDLRPAKAALRPIYDRMVRQYPVTKAQASSGLKALQNIVEGPDHAPLSQVDADLGAIKTIARADIPELRSVSQGMAAHAVKQLDDWVKMAAESAGPEALQALEQGRKSTVAKYVAGDLLETLSNEPVQVFRRLTAPKDTAIAQLRQIAKQAPDEVPKLGRALLDGMMDQATQNGSFEHAAKLYADWQRVGPETKRLLFSDPAHVAELDQFFRLAKKIAENPNPSGTARVNNIFNLASAAVGYPIAKLLYSKAGVKLLSEGYRVPLQSAAATANYSTRLSSALKAAAAAMDPAMAGDTQPEPARPTVRR